MNFGLVCSQAIPKCTHDDHARIIRLGLTRDADDMSGQHLCTDWAEGHDQRQRKSQNLHPIALCCPTLPIVLEDLIHDFWVFQMPFANHETDQTHSPRTDVSAPASG
jgi:hypothetical protein